MYEKLSTGKLPRDQRRIHGLLGMPHDTENDYSEEEIIKLKKQPYFFKVTAVTFISDRPKKYMMTYLN
jgi:hypothetical protein